MDMIFYSCITVAIAVIGYATWMLFSSYREERAEEDVKIFTFCSMHQEYDDDCGICNPAVRARELWEENNKLLAEAEKVKTLSMPELACINQNVLEYMAEWEDRAEKAVEHMTHWKDRAEKAEAKLAELSKPKSKPKAVVETVVPEGSIDGSNSIVWPPQDPCIKGPDCFGGMPTLPSPAKEAAPPPPPYRGPKPPKSGSKKK